VGEGPEGVAVDPSTGRVGVALRRGLAVVDGRSGRLLDTVMQEGAPRHLQFDPAGGRLLIPAEQDAMLRTLDLSRPREAPTATPTGAQPHDATAAGGRVFVGDERAGTVTVVEGGRRIGSFGVARQPGGLAPAAGGRQVAVVSVRDRVVELFDARSYRRLGRANAGVGPTHVVSDGASTLYVTDTAGDALLVFRTRPELQLVRRLAMATSPYGIALDRRHRRLFVTLTGTNRLIKLWTNGPRTVADVPTVRQPDTVAVDEETGRAFVTGRSDGVLQLLDPADR
jgi:DNA-binding beta-propeller fold protein YncE